MDEVVNKIRSCLIVLKEIDTVIDYDTTVSWFQNLCLLLSDLFITTADFVKRCNYSYVKSIKESLFLYLLQLITLLSLLIKIFINENASKVNNVEARKFTIKQIEVCLYAIESSLSSEKTDLTTESFLKWMNLALDKLSQIDVENDKANSIKYYEETKRCVEEVLCHGMSIAQIALPNDCNIIKGSSKSVLEVLESLHDELLGDGRINFCNLSVDYCYDKLCGLERKVNFAVLRLSLKVFSRLNDPLEELSRYCNCHMYNEEKFDNLVADFDLHVDRIMQIGLFAVAASTSNKTTIKMRSCLASLEALEGELVPSFNNLLLNPTASSKKFCDMLKDYWKQQAEALKNLIYVIVDPFAFCQVVYEELKLYIESNELNKETINSIVFEGRVLIDLVRMSASEMELDNINSILVIIQEIKIMLHEVECAANVLLGDREIFDTKGVERINRRVGIYKDRVKKLLFALSNYDLEDKEKSDNKDDGNCEIDLETDRKLTEIIHRGRELLEERSILYKTPTKRFNNTKFNEANQIIYNDDRTNQKPMSLLKMVHLRNLRFSYSKISDSAQTDLQVTDILADLENVSSSLRKQFNSCSVDSS